MKVRSDISVEYNSCNVDGIKLSTFMLLQKEVGRDWEGEKGGWVGEG